MRDPTPALPVQRSVQSVEAGGRLLLVLAEAGAALPLKELAERAGLTPSRAHPHLVSFGRLGLIEQRPGSSAYALGPAALRIGLAALHQLDPLREAEPVAQALAESTGHAVALAVWGNLGPTVVRLFEAREPLHVAIRVGSVMSLTGTATGRAFVGALPLARLRPVAESGRIGEQPAGSWAERAARLSEIADEVRRHGLARAAGSPIPGVNAFSAAVPDAQGEVAVVITALDHAARLPAAWSSPAAQAVRAAAERVAARLGGGPEVR
jgi:DNA-binding IclR family transcriptional regulator